MYTCVDIHLHIHTCFKSQSLCKYKLNIIHMYILKLSGVDLPIESLVNTNLEKYCKQGQLTCCKPILTQQQN